MYAEDELLPLSALQHLAFCERQWALIHLEGVWVENRLTMEGRLLHERAHTPQVEQRGDEHIARGLRLHSLRLGLSGIADVVEFHWGGSGLPPAPAAREAIPGPGWAPFPVEYKRGRPKPGPCDLVQLCAHALCLEEMLAVAVPRGAIYYGAPRHRLAVEFADDLRNQTEALAARLHALTDAGRTPAPRYAARCDACSLVALCLPKAAAAGHSARRYLARAIADATRDPAGEEA